MHTELDTDSLDSGQVTGKAICPLDLIDHLPSTQAAVHTAVSGGFWSTEHGTGTFTGQSISTLGTILLLNYYGTLDSGQDIEANYNMMYDEHAKLKPVS